MTKPSAWPLIAAVFISNVCIMVIELLAGRLLAPIIGVSLHTWTGIIGVIFAGMSIGNYLGGRLADRHASFRVLGLLYAAAGIAAIAVSGALLLAAPAYAALPPGLPLLLRITLAVAIVFLAPSLALGAITPLVVKLAVRDLRQTGTVVGRIYAASALGSILGTFATGYGLIFYFGVRSILLGVAGMLILLGLLIMRIQAHVSEGMASDTRADLPEELAELIDSAAFMPAVTAAPILRSPALIVFVSNTCLMLVQLVASRLVAPIVGVSLYTWTSIIGVMLAGISLGNALGGWLADRHGSRRLLSTLLLLTALSLVLVLVIFYIGAGTLGLPPLPELPLVARVAIFFAGLFFLPSVMLGTISPVVIKLAMNDLTRAGRTMGRIAGASTLGNILGTFATGFFLISTFGTRLTLFGALIALAVLGFWLGDWGRARWPGRVAAGLTAASLFAAPLTPVNALLTSGCLRETDYFCIRIREDDREGRTFHVLTLDRLVHSYVALDDPRDMRYQYEKIGAEVADFLHTRDGRVASYFIGGGGYSLPKYIEVSYPASRIDVAEIDPGVTAIAHERLALPLSTTIRTFNEDARLHLADTLPGPVYNFVLGDAFNDFSVPYHLTTHEFNQLVRSHMTDDGVYMLNLIDGGSLPFVGAFLRTLRRTFGHVYLITSGGALFGVKRNTFVVLASNQPIDMTRLRTFASADNIRDIDKSFVENEEIMKLVDSDMLILTDDFAPTDRLLAPMFEASER